MNWSNIHWSKVFEKEAKAVSTISLTVMKRRVDVPKSPIG
jgi:hypothetical protein